MKSRNRRIMFAVGALLTVGCALAAWFVYPYFSFDERVRRSLPALDAYALRVQASNGAALTHPPGHLGYFNVGKVEKLPHGFLFESDFGGPFDRNAIAYSSESPPAGDYSTGHGDFFTPIGGNWYEVLRQ